MTEKDKDFLEGLAISVACHVLPVRKVFREPIAYSYNGVILPALPEWDREAYPYAVIDGPKSDGTYELAVCQSALVYDGVDVKQTELLRYLLYKATENSWEYDNHYQTYVVVFNGCAWTNHDIVNSTDNTIYLAASEPTPVYE